MPVSSTATTTPFPLNGDVSAPTALIPHSTFPAAGCASVALAIGSINFIGMAGATATTLAS
jgi:hypothetical protein